MPQMMGVIVETLPTEVNAVYPCILLLQEFHFTLRDRERFGLSGISKGTLTGGSQTVSLHC